MKNFWNATEIYINETRAFNKFSLEPLRNGCIQNPGTLNRVRIGELFIRECCQQWKCFGGILRPSTETIFDSKFSVPTDAIMPTYVFMYSRISATLWLTLNWPARRVPSDNRIWIDVVGLVESKLMISLALQWNNRNSFIVLARSISICLKKIISWRVSSHLQFLIEFIVGGIAGLRGGRGCAESVTFTRKRRNILIVWPDVLFNFLYQTIKIGSLQTIDFALKSWLTIRWHLTMEMYTKCATLSLYLIPIENECRHRLNTLCHSRFLTPVHVNL